MFLRAVFDSNFVLQIFCQQCYQRLATSGSFSANLVLTPMVLSLGALDLLSQQCLDLQLATGGLLSAISVLTLMASLGTLDHFSYGVYEMKLP